MAHSYWKGEPLTETWELMGPWIRHVHVKDGYRNTNGAIVQCLPGQGTLPIRECRDLLISKGYRGYFSLEWERKWHPELPELEEALPAFVKVMQDS